MAHNIEEIEALAKIQSKDPDHLNGKKHENTKPHTGRKHADHHASIKI